MKNKKYNGIIAVIFILLVVGWITWFNLHEKETSTTLLVTPPISTTTIQTSLKIVCDSECEKQNEELIKLREKIKISMEKIGCSEYGSFIGIEESGYFCYSKDGREYRSPFFSTTTPIIEWIETEESINTRSCEPYKYSKLGDLPVYCLEYYKLTN